MKRLKAIWNCEFPFFFARARISKTIALPLVLWLGGIFISAANVNAGVFTAGADGRIHGIALDHGRETSTRNALRITDRCAFSRSTATARPLVASDDAMILPHLSSQRGVLVLDGLRPGAAPKTLFTQLLSPHNNDPISIAGEKGIQPGPRYTMALTFAATLAGHGDLAIAAGDFVNIKADGQVYRYRLPALTIPSEGVLRVFAGTDDTFYYDAALTHP